MKKREFQFYTLESVWSCDLLWLKNRAHMNQPIWLEMRQIKPYDSYMLKKLFPSTLSEIIHGVLSHPYNTRIKEVKELHLVARKGQKIQIVNTQA